MRVRRLRWSMAALALALVPLTGSAEPDFAVPTMGVDRIVATGDDGRPLGTLVLPSIVAGDRTRPLLVVFNGGPGAASAWLQLGLLGPWQFGGDGRLVPNRRATAPRRPLVRSSG